MIFVFTGAVKAKGGVIEDMWELLPPHAAIAIPMANILAYF